MKVRDVLALRPQGEVIPFRSRPTTTRTVLKVREVLKAKPQPEGNEPLYLVQREAPPSPEPEAEPWLQFQLASGPQRIAVLIGKWVGTLDNPTGRDVDDLMAARWTLGVHAYVGDDGRFWWQLPGDNPQ